MKPGRRFLWQLWAPELLHPQGNVRRRRHGGQTLVQAATVEQTTAILQTFLGATAGRSCTASIRNKSQMKLQSHSDNSEVSKMLKRPLPPGHPRRCTTRCSFPAPSVNLSTTNRCEPSLNGKQILGQRVTLETSKDRSDQGRQKGKTQESRSCFDSSESTLKSGPGEQRRWQRSPAGTLGSGFPCCSLPDDKCSADSSIRNCSQP